MDLNAYLDEVCACRDVDRLGRVLIAAFDGLGASAVFGHALPFGGARAMERAWEPIISTFPLIQLEYYRERMAQVGDPFLDAALANGAPVHLLKVSPSLAWSQDQLGLFKVMFDLGYRDSVATPVFARPGLYAYFAVAFPQPRPDLTGADLRRIKFLFSEYFYRYGVLRRKDFVRLSPREREVLLAIVSNKSNTEIAKDLGVSTHTVDTYVKRCFKKLEVNSRTEAVLKWFGGGFEAGP